MTDMWNPALETLPRERLRALQLRKFREQCEHVYEHSGFYRRKFDDAGVHPTDIDSFEAVRDVPMTTKADLREAQGRDPFPYGDLLADDPVTVTEYHQTSGTTGEAVRQADSWADWEWWGETWATVLWAQGIRPDDRVFFPFSYNVFVAFWAAHYACERIGAEVVPGGNLSSAQRIRTMDELDVTAFMGTPTYALRLAEVAREEGVDPSSMAVDRIVCAGEPGASIPATKARIEAEWGATVFDHAGATEAGAWGFAAEGVDELGLFINEAFFLAEVLGEDGEPVAGGERGELVITPLDRRAQPYVRFRLRDLVEVVPSPGPERTFRFAKGGILGRTDDLTKVNGVLLSPTTIEDVVRAFEPVTDEYRVLIEEHPEKDIDSITVVVEADPRVGAGPDAIRDGLRQKLKHRINLTADIDIRDDQALDRPELKADRVTDTRPDRRR